MSPSSDQESSFQTPTDPDFVFTPPHLIAPNMHQWFQDLESKFHQEDVKEIPRRPPSSPPTILHGDTTLP